MVPPHLIVDALALVGFGWLCVRGLRWLDRFEEGLGDELDNDRREVRS